MSQLNMPTINQVSLSGRVVQEPEYRVLESGVAKLSARIAVNHRYRDRSENWQEETSFFSIVLWHKPAELFAERLHKGTPVYVNGRLRSFSWRDEKDQPHTIVEVQVRHLQILERDPSQNGKADSAEIEEAAEIEEEAELAAA
ncbi:MAG: single-stranded DNA-binding protein [Candidatus Latescibacterota bacterium]|jgi:single-strand DNA-binding protein